MKNLLNLYKDVELNPKNKAFWPIKEYMITIFGTIFFQDPLF